MKYLILFMSLFSIARADFPLKDSADITYNWLSESEESQATDYIPYIKEIFDHVQVKAFLQFGVSYSTKYLIDKCKRVVSIDFVTSGCGPAQIKEFLGYFRSFINWIPIVYFTNYTGETNWAFFKYLGSDAVFKASNYQSTIYKSYSSIDKTYINELTAFLGNLIKLNRFEAAFINPVTFIRGDLVQILFSKIPIIIAQDTASRTSLNYSDVYGYREIKTPDDYHEIQLPGSHGTIIWILKDPKYDALVDALRQA